MGVVVVSITSNSQGHMHKLRPKRGKRQAICHVVVGLESPRFMRLSASLTAKQLRGGKRYFLLWFNIFFLLQLPRNLQLPPCIRCGCHQCQSIRCIRWALDLRLLPPVVFPFPLLGINPFAGECAWG